MGTKKRITISLRDDGFVKCDLGKRPIEAFKLISILAELIRCYSIKSYKQEKKRWETNITKKE